MPAELSLAALSNILLRHADGGSGGRAATSVKRAKQQLSERMLSTQLNHVTRVEKLLKALGTKDVGGVFRRPAEVVGYLERPAGYTASSRMSFYSSLCALVNPEKPYAPEIINAAGASHVKRARKVYLERNAYWNRKVSEKQLRLTKARTKTGGALPFKTIVRQYKNKRSALAPEDRLLADMYLAAPDDPSGAVRRANYGCCWVFGEEPDAAELPDKTNYIIVPKQKRKRVTIVLNRYKTAKSHGEYRADLPAALASRVRKSIEDAPRPLLFYTKAEGEFQCLTPNAFAKRVTSTMKELTGQPLGVNQLRRSYSSYVIDKGLTDDQLKLFAKGMNSSVSVMRKVYQRRSLMRTSS